VKLMIGGMTGWLDDGFEVERTPEELARAAG
jgi:3-mercaptopyruvate sulfurtransferase SseA